ELPSDVVVEHVQDALQAQSVRHRLRPRRPLWPGRQQRLDQQPQVIVHDPRARTHTSRTDGSSHQSRPTSTSLKDRVTSSYKGCLMNIPLLCLPFAGAGASFYTAWDAIRVPGVDVVPLLLPGRER